MHKILLVGALQSGKTTTATAIMGYHLTQKGIIPNFSVRAADGSAFITYDKEQNIGIEFDIESIDSEFTNWLSRNIYPEIINIRFAEELKRTSMDLFGLPHESIYGTNEQKNEKIHIKTIDIMRLINGLFMDDITAERYEILNYNHFYERIKKNRNDKLSGREFMQLFGSEICRTIFDDCHINSAINKAKKYNSNIAIITDGRFDNEVRAIKELEDCTIIKLLRTINNKVTHSSETAAAGIDDKEYDLIVPENMEIHERNDFVINFLIERGVLNKMDIKKKNE